AVMIARALTSPELSNPFGTDRPRRCSGRPLFGKVDSHSLRLLLSLASSTTAKNFHIPKSSVTDDLSQPGGRPPSRRVKYLFATTLGVFHVPGCRDRVAKVFAKRSCAPHILLAGNVNPDKTPIRKKLIVKRWN